eukprot:scaffold237852_cov17-Tisochrysis_lutea.AAC.1
MVPRPWVMLEEFSNAHVVFLLFASIPGRPTHNDPIKTLHPALLKTGMFASLNLHPALILSVSFTAWRARHAQRAYERYQKAVSLDRLKRHRPDVYKMLRKPRSTHQTLITAEGWSAYLQ